MAKGVTEVYLLYLILYQFFTGPQPIVDNLLLLQQQTHLSHNFSHGAKRLGVAEFPQFTDPSFIRQVYTTACRVGTSGHYGATHTRQRIYSLIAMRGTACDQERGRQDENPQCTWHLRVIPRQVEVITVWSLLTHSSRKTRICVIELCPYLWPGKWLVIKTQTYPLRMLAFKNAVRTMGPSQSGLNALMGYKTKLTVMYH